MVARYTISANSYVEIFLWDDFFEQNCHRRLEIIPYYNGVRGRKAKKDVLFHDGIPYFIWNGKTIYLNEFDFYTSKELDLKVKNGEYFSNDELMASIIRDRTFAIVCDINISMLGQRVLRMPESVKAKCVPINPKPYSCSISFQAEDENIAAYSSVKSFYSMDLTLLIRDGIVKIFTGEIENSSNEKETFVDKFKRIFKKG